MSENEPTPESIRPGMLFCERYRIERKLDDGGMASVWLAVDENSGLPVAIKVLFIRYSDNSVVRARFLDEGRIQAMLQHPNIVHVYRIIPDPVLSFVMEYIDGESLEEYLQRQGPLDETEMVDLMMPVMSAVGFAHGKGIVHRDLKPSNILLKPGSGYLEPKVMDFGVAKINRGKELTAAGTTVGTLHYMSPEQIVGARDIDGRADIYSLGCSLYKLCTGEVPFNASSEFALMMAQVEAAPTPPSELRPELSEPMEAIILRALAKEPENRFQTIKEMTSALMRVSELNEDGDTATRPVPGELLQFAMEADEVALDQSAEFRLETLVIEDAKHAADTDTIEGDVEPATMTHELSASALLQIERDRLKAADRHTKTTAERPAVGRSDLMNMETIERDSIKRDRIDRGDRDLDDLETVEQDAYKDLDPDAVETIERDALRRDNFARSFKRDDIARSIEREMEQRKRSAAPNQSFDDEVSADGDDSEEPGLATTTERAPPKIDKQSDGDDGKFDATRKVPYPRSPKSSSHSALDPSADETVDLNDFVSRERLSEAYAATAIPEQAEDDDDETINLRHDEIGEADDATINLRRDEIGEDDDATINLHRDEIGEDDDATINLRRDDLKEQHVIIDGDDVDSKELTHRVSRSEVVPREPEFPEPEDSETIELGTLELAQSRVSRADSTAGEDPDATMKQIPSVRMADDIDDTSKQIPSAKKRGALDSTSKQTPSSRRQKSLDSTSKQTPSSRRKKKLDSTSKQTPSSRRKKKLDSGPGRRPGRKKIPSKPARRPLAGAKKKSGPSQKANTRKKQRSDSGPQRSKSKHRSRSKRPSKSANVDKLALPPKPGTKGDDTPDKRDRRAGLGAGPAADSDDVEKPEPRPAFRKQEATARHDVERHAVSSSGSVWLTIGIIAAVLALVVFAIALYMS